MLTDEAFLQAIRANPEDEASWLIYADWLEERGDPRATLYRCPRLTNALGMRLVLVPRGSFWMGARGKQRQVEVPHEFYLGACPVTQGQWQAVMGSNPSYFSSGDQVRDLSDADLKFFPVEQVSWDGVQEFLKQLNGREVENGLLYRLPTEAEWEYACRAAATSLKDCSFDYYFAEPTNDLSSAQANFDGRYPAGNAPQGNYLGRTSKVGSYPPNRLGLYDMHGNVWEWCQDFFREGAAARVFRGGSWRYDASYSRAAIRGSGDPTSWAINLGVRLAAVPSGK
jgi:uncharacterized protein (TIGR02996 family)